MTILKATIKYSADLLHDFSVLRKVKRNQREIIKLSKSHGKTVHLDSNKLDCGNIEHYYHFVFDLLLPLSLIIDKVPRDTIFSIHNFGPLTKNLLIFFSDRIKITTVSKEDKKNILFGMNPTALRVLNFNFHRLVKTAFHNFKTLQNAIRKKVLLIERVAPDPYYLMNANNKGSGTSRRSIVNHQELKNMIQSEISAQYEFHNLVLEELTLEDQVQYFGSAALIIGQHGAGLANIVWMKNGSMVIEFGFNSNNHFQKISRSKKHKHYTYKNHREKHITIDIDDFRIWLTSNQQLKKFLKH